MRTLFMPFRGGMGLECFMDQILEGMRGIAGGALTLLREGKGWTLEELYNRTGVTVDKLRNLEEGKLTEDELGEDDHQMISVVLVTNTDSRETTWSAEQIWQLINCCLGISRGIFPELFVRANRTVARAAVGGWRQILE